MRIRFIASATILCAFLMFSCEKDDDNSSSGGGSTDTTGTSEKAFEAIIDGVDFESHPLLIAGTMSSAGVSARLASGTYIYSNGDTVTIAITGTAFDMDAFETGADFDGSNTILGNYCFGNVLITNGAVDIEASSDELDIAQMTITAYDENEGTFSGTFSFEAKDDDTNVSYTVTNGLFTNVEFD